MKLQKLYDDVHRGVKVEAAKRGKPSVRVASLLLRKGLQDLEAGLITIPEDDEAEQVSVAKRKPAGK